MTQSIVHVAVGVIIDDSGHVLLGRRLKGTHLAGYWEFPGGKVEPDETVLQALDRELKEELDIRIGATSPLIDVKHDYGDKQVWLDVHRVLEWQGTAKGVEGQPLAWVGVDSLDDFKVPDANAAIMAEVRKLLTAI